MLYLIGKGVESGLAFTIMESVTKGKGLKPEWKKEMKRVKVYDWYIDSCKKIKYKYMQAYAKCQRGPLADPMHGQGRILGILN